MGRPRLFLDADGVLADFDKGARRLLGLSPKDFIARHGRGRFWSRLAKAKNFYGDLPEMSDARLLFDAVKHLEPIILTGLPLGSWAGTSSVTAPREGLADSGIVPPSTGIALVSSSISPPSAKYSPPPPPP